MKLKDFYELVNYCNIAWRGFFSRAELISMLADMYAEYKLSVLHKQLTHTMYSLCERLAEDGTERCLEWRERILQTSK